MSEATFHSLDPQRPLVAVHEALEQGALDVVREWLELAHAAETAALLEALPIAERDQVWELLAADRRADVLAELDDGVRAERSEQMAPAELAAIAVDIDEDDAADFCLRS